MKLGDLETNLRLAGLAFGKKAERVGGEPRQIVGAVGDQIFRHRARIKLGEKAARRARIKGRENFFRPRDQGARCGIVLAAGRRGRGGFPRAENRIGRIHVFARIPQCRPNQRQSAHKHMTMAGT